MVTAAAAAATAAESEEQGEQEEQQQEGKQYSSGRNWRKSQSATGMKEKRVAWCLKPNLALKHHFVCSKGYESG